MKRNIIQTIIILLFQNKLNCLEKLEGAFNIGFEEEINFVHVWSFSMNCLDEMYWGSALKKNEPVEMILNRGRLSLTLVIGFVFHNIWYLSIFQVNTFI